MSAKTWQHVSPKTGLGLCQAQSPEACRFGAEGHFSAKAAQRIKEGVPANYKEHEAMREHQKATGQEVAPPRDFAPKPKPAPPKAPLTVQQPAARTPAKSNGFPTGHQRPKQGDEILYHAEVGFPKNFRPPLGQYKLDYTKHALDASEDDRYGTIPILKGIDTTRMKLIEMGMQNGKVSKFLYRGTLACIDCKQNSTPQSECSHPIRDMCVVVIPKPTGTPWLVKTVWINLQDDKHRTLDTSKYQKPE